MLKLMDLLTEGVHDKGIFKAVFLAGGPGSGKSYVAQQLFGIPEKVNVSTYGLKMVNQDQELELFLNKFYGPKSGADSTVDYLNIQAYPPELFKPDTWRGRPINSKQGSDGTVDLGATVDHNLETTMQSCLILYNTLIDKGVAPEQARMVLPQSMMTEWFWSGSLYAFARVCNLRCKPDVQKETRDICNQISNECSKYFPISWKYLKENDE